MSVNQFVQNAVYHLYGDISRVLPLPLQSLEFDDPVDQFISQMRKTGAKVFVNNRDYYFSNAFGPISDRLRGKTRKYIRKSLAFLRIRQYTNHNFRVRLGVAQYAAVLIDKNDMIKLQLLNQCRSARLYIYSDDIYSAFSQANDLITSTQADGYYVSGPQPLICMPLNMVRNIPTLSVYLIRKEKHCKTTRKMFL